MVLVAQYILTERQALIEEGLVNTGRFGNKSELMRNAIEALWRKSSKDERVNILVELYAKHPMSVAFAAEVAGVGVVAMQQALKAAGVLRLGYNDERTEKAASRLAERL